MNTDPFLPLAGLNVLELPGREELSTCGGLLAALGATVLVQAGAQPPTARQIEGKTLLVRDAAPAPDVILYSPDVVPLTLTPPATAILCSITAYGATGPLAGLRHPEALVQAMAGIAHTTGRADGPPCLTGAPFVGMETAVYAAAAILAALRHRAVTGQGQRIDMALYDVAVNALLTFLPLVFTGRPASRAGNRHPTLAPWNAYRAADGWVLICAPTNDQWRRLAAVMGTPDLATEPGFATTTARFENVAALDARIGSWTALRTVAQVVAAVDAAGIPCGPIHELADLERDPNLIHRGTLTRAAEGSLLVQSPIRATGPALPASPPPGPMPMASLRIVEIGMNTVAPLAGRQLGALGAQVIKVEPPSGDSNRANTPLRDSDGQSYVFALSNTDKSGVVLDLRDPDDAQALWDLIDTADAVIENLKPGSLARLGFGAAAIRARKPSIVHCSVSGFGQDSVWPGRPALDTVVQALSGAMAATPVDGMPIKAGISISDQLGGQFGLLGLLAALHRRDRTGEGASLDIAMQDCTVWATQHCFDQRPPPATILPCTDGWIAATAPAETEQMSVADALAACAARGIDAAPVLSVAEVTAAAQTSARGLLTEVPTPDGSRWTVLASPLRLEGSPAKVRGAMPRLGWTAESGQEVQHA